MHRDIFGRLWDVDRDESCPVCGQPDNCGDCNHEPLSDEQLQQMGESLVAER